MTIMLTPFIPCSAKLPVIALFTAVFFPDAAFVFPLIYGLAGALIILGGLFLKRIFHHEGSSSFIIELPEYRLPSLRHGMRQMTKQAKAFIVKASTIILVMNTLIWFMQTYTWKLTTAASPAQSILAAVSGLIAPLLLPLGFSGWQAAAASLAGLSLKKTLFQLLRSFSLPPTPYSSPTAGPLASQFTRLSPLLFWF
jgi:ferrous iron transport protein B